MDINNGMLINFGRILNAPNNKNYRTTFAHAHKDTSYKAYGTAERAQHWVNVDVRTATYVDFYICDYGLATPSNFNYMTIGS